MRNIIGNLAKRYTDIDDDIIALSMLASAKEAADMYLNSALTSSTPELRVIYSAALTQMVEGHTSLTELGITKKWIKPYSSSTDLIIDSYKEAQAVIDEHK